MATMTVAAKVEEVRGVSRYHLLQREGHVWSVTIALSKHACDDVRHDLTEWGARFVYDKLGGIPLSPADVPNAARIANGYGARPEESAPKPAAPETPEQAHARGVRDGRASAFKDAAEWHEASRALEESGLSRVRCPTTRNLMGHYIEACETARDHFRTLATKDPS